MIKKKILSPTALQSVLTQARKRSKKIVFTNGCFDLLHAGHVMYLEKARALGDVLVVAINTDSSVKKLKGPARPLNPLKDREQVLAALESVSYVTSFADETPLNLIKKLKPDVLVKGGDYDLNKIVGAKETKASGGKVKTIPFLKGRSTTGLIKKINS